MGQGSYLACVRDGVPLVIPTTLTATSLRRDRVGDRAERVHSPEELLFLSPAPLLYRFCVFEELFYYHSLFFFLDPLER